MRCCVVYYSSYRFLVLVLAIAIARVGVATGVVGLFHGRLEDHPGIDELYPFDELSCSDRPIIPGLPSDIIIM